MAPRRLSIWNILHEAGERRGSHSLNRSMLNTVARAPLNVLFGAFFCILFFPSFGQGPPGGGGVDTCGVTVTADTTTVPCSGGSVTLSADAIAGTNLMVEDFDDKGLDPGWTSNQNVDFSNPCDANTDGSPYAWLGPSATQPRELTTESYDVSCGGEICFDLDFSEQGSAGNSGNDCEGPDLPDEGVHFQYSTDNGTSWTDIQYFNPDTACCGCGGGCGGENPSPFVDWDTYCFQIPAAAQGPNTKFRWYQTAGSGSCCDHWGIDDVTIIGSGCDFDYDWKHVTGVPNDSQQTVTVNSDTTFKACYTNIHNGGSDSCCSSIMINTEGIDSVSFDTITETCDKDDDGEIAVNTHGGSGPYTYYLNGPEKDTNSSGTFTPLPDGDYFIKAVESGGCSASDSVQLLPGATCCVLVHDSSIAEDVSCYGAGDGSATVYASKGPAPYQYQWFDVSGNPLPGQSSQKASGLDPGTYIVQVMDQDSCTVADTLTITQPSGPWYVETSSDSAHCGKPDGVAYVDSVFGNVQPHSYQWGAGANNQTGATANSLTPGAYDVTISGAEGCDTTLTIDVPNISGHNTSIASKTNVSCFGGSDGSATAQVSGGTAPYTYQWNDPSKQNGKNATGLSANSYNVVVTDANGCKDSASVTISEPSPFQVTASSDTTICIGGAAVMDANASGGTPPYSFHWDQGVGTGKVQSVSPGSNTIYKVYAEDANGCTSAKASVRIQYHPKLTVDAFKDDSICPGKTASLSAIGSGGSGKGYSYSWSNGDNGKATTVSPSSKTTYTVTLEDNCETPVASSDVTIALHELPDVKIEGKDLEACAPVNADLINATDPSMVGGQCIWDLGNGQSSSSCDTVEQIYTTPGCYDIDLSVRSPEGCVDSTTVQDMVCVRPYPKASFDHDPEKATVQDPAFTFGNRSVGASSYAWDFGGLDSSVQENPVYEFPADSSGAYEVCMEASTQYGCRDTTCETVAIRGESIIYVPNAFTPDGDGVNDKFGPVVQGIDRSDYSFFIYDRWGEIVFESNHPEKKWDGSVKGEMSESKTDVYVWRLVTKSAHTGKKIQKRGHVTLIR